MRKINAKSFILSFMLSLFSITLPAQENPKNPYDNAGKLHNKVISGFIKKYGNKNLTVKETIIKTLEECKKQGIEVNDKNVDEKVFIDLVNDKKYNFVNIVKKSTLSKKSKSILIKFFNEIGNLKNGSPVDYKTVYKKIVEMEQRILDDKSIATNERKILLESMSIARYSLHFWYNYYNNPTGSASQAKKKWWRWVVIGLADVAGGILGSSSGGLGAVKGACLASSTANQILK